MGFSAICLSHKYLLTRNNSGKSEEISDNLPVRKSYFDSNMISNENRKDIRRFL